MSIHLGLTPSERQRKFSQVGTDKSQQGSESWDCKKIDTLTNGRGGSLFGNQE